MILDVTNEMCVAIHQDWVPTGIEDSSVTGTASIQIK